MKRVSLKVAMDMFGGQRIGTYEFDGSKQDMYKWKDCIFYFDGVDKTIAVGNIPMAEALHFYDEFKNYKDVTFANGDYGETDKSKATIDPTTYDDKVVLKQGVHRVYYMKSMRTLIAFLLYMELYKKEFAIDLKSLDSEQIEKKKKEMSLHVDELLSAYYGLGKSAVESTIKSRLPIAKTVPKIPKTPLDSTSSFLFEREYLSRVLELFDQMINPYEGLNLDDREYDRYIKDIDVNIDYLGENREISLTNRISFTRAVYKYDGKSTSYTATYQSGELSYQRVIHAFCQSEDKHFDGELVIVMPLITPRVKELTKRAVIYNMSKNIILKEGTWTEATSEDINVLSAEVEDITAYITTDIISKMFTPKKLKYKKVDAIESKKD